MPKLEAPSWRWLASVLIAILVTGASSYIVLGNELVVIESRLSAAETEIDVHDVYTVQAQSLLVELNTKVDMILEKIDGAL